MAFIDYFNDRSTFDQVRYICNLLEPYEDRIDTILAENNSIGSPMIDLLKDEFVRRGKMRLHNAVIPFTTTNREKARLVNQLQVALEQSPASTRFMCVRLNRGGVLATGY